MKNRKVLKSLPIYTLSIRANGYISFVMVFGLLLHQKHKPKEIE
jgi:hypothetical protein